MCTLAEHEALKRDPSRWSKLERLPDLYDDGEGVDPPTRLELRNCACGSTLALPIKTEEI